MCFSCGHWFILWRVERDREAGLSVADEQDRMQQLWALKERERDQLRERARERERERGVCVIVGQILVVKEMVLTVDY